MSYRFSSFLSYSVSDSFTVFYINNRKFRLPLQLLWKGHTFLFDLFEDGLGGMIHSAGVNSLDSGFATSLVALEMIGFGKRGIASLRSKTSSVFGQVLDVTAMVIAQVEVGRRSGSLDSIECPSGGGPAPHSRLPPRHTPTCAC